MVVHNLTSRGFDEDFEKSEVPAGYQASLARRSLGWSSAALANGAQTCQQLVQASILGGISREEGTLGLGPSF